MFDFRRCGLRTTNNGIVEGHNSIQNRLHISPQPAVNILQIQYRELLNEKK
jgi:hypothetical protein